MYQVGPRVIAAEVEPRVLQQPSFQNSLWDMKFIHGFSTNAKQMVTATSLTAQIGYGFKSNLAIITIYI